jgi:hypothetical protein
MSPDRTARGTVTATGPLPHRPYDVAVVGCAVAHCP